MKHREERHPAPPSTMPAGGLELMHVTRHDTGGTLRVVGKIHPRPHLRLEESNGQQTRVVTVLLSEIGTLVTALIGAVRRMTGRGKA